MHLHRLKLHDFRNLRDFEIRFDREVKDLDGNARILRSHAIIGQNGSGKSNLLEALVMIFRDLDLHQSASLTYELDYEVRGHQVRVSAEKDQMPKVWIDGGEKESFFVSDVHRETNDAGVIERGHAREYLPSHIFTYYSGKNLRLEELFRDHQMRYIENLETFEEVQDSDPLIRRLFYCRHPHSRLVLLSCLLAPEKPLKAITDLLEIEDVDSALFVLKRPYRLRDDSLEKEDLAQGDQRFWYDRTRFSQEFLDKLWSLATAPIGHTEERLIDFRGRLEEQEVRYLFLKDKQALMELKEAIGDSYQFFKHLEGSYVADLLDDVRIHVKRRTSDQALAVEQLSEGEMQLLTVLGLMRITHEDHCLFLLDEPDTHLNPLWKLRYFDDIEAVLQPDPDKTLQGESQIIVTTHDPLMVGGLLKDQLRILNTGQGHSTVSEPDEHPQGMGFAGLLKSELFGLRSTVDSATRKRLDRRNHLYALGDKRTKKQSAEMERLSRELADLGFASDFRDPYFELFVKKMALHTKFHQDTLTPDLQAEQNRVASKIIDEILAEEAGKK